MGQERRVRDEMSTGIRVTVAFPDGGDCPIAERAATAGANVDRVDTSVAPAGEDAVSEFYLDAPSGSTDATPVFSFGDAGLYRVAHGAADCPCGLLGRHGCPVSQYRAGDDGLTVEFFAAEFDEVQTVVGDLRDAFPDLDVRRMIRSAPDTRRDGVFVDRSALTERQREALVTAYEMGYFERPRGANATEVAEAMDIEPSTLSEHLATAQSKVLADVLGDQV